jgi:hypothetical protein
LPSFRYESYEKGNTQKAKKAFDEMKRLSKEQSDRLSDLIEMVMTAYRNADVSRFQKIEQIENVSTGAKQLAVGSRGASRLEDQVAALLNKAAWMEAEYSASMKELEAMFNGAKSIAEICKKGGVNDEGGRWTRGGGKKVAMRIAAFSLDKEDSERVVKMSMGPPKGEARALVKLQEGAKKGGYERAKRAHGRSERVSEAGAWQKGARERSECVGEGSAWKKGARGRRERVGEGSAWKKGARGRRERVGEGSAWEKGARGRRERVSEASA